MSDEEKSLTDSYKCLICGRSSVNEDSHFCLGNLNGYKFIKLSDIIDWTNERRSVGNPSDRIDLIFREGYNQCLDDLLSRFKLRSDETNGD